MKIGMKCGCGAAAEWEDNRGARDSATSSSVYPYGKLIIVLQSEEWMKRHTACKLKEDDTDIKAMGFIQE